MQHIQSQLLRVLYRSNQFNGCWQVSTTSDKALTLFHDSLAEQEPMQQQQNSNTKGSCTLLVATNSSRNHALIQKIACSARALLQHKLLVMLSATGGCCRSACCCLFQLVFSHYLADLQELRALLCSMGQRGSPPLRSLSWVWLPRPPGLEWHT